MHDIKTSEGKLIKFSRNEFLTKKNEKPIQLTFKEELKSKIRNLSQDSKKIIYRIKDENFTFKNINTSEIKKSDPNKENFALYPKDKVYLLTENNKVNLPNILPELDNNPQIKRKKSCLKKKTPNLKTLFFRTGTITQNILSNNNELVSSSINKNEFNKNDKLINEMAKTSKFLGLNKQNTVVKNNNPLELSFGECLSALREKEEYQISQKNTVKHVHFFLDTEPQIKKNATHSFIKIQTINGYTFKKTDKKFLLHAASKKSDNLGISNLEKQYPNYPKVKCSKNKINEQILCYAVNTYKGTNKNHNEDKVSMILSISKPKNFEGYWPKCSFIALYDGKFGKICSNFLRDELHNYIIKNKNFPEDPKKSIYEGFLNAEKDFQKKISENNSDNSGSCALVLLIIDDKLYIANCGDSHAILSMQKGEKFELLNKVHKLPKKIEIDQKKCDMSEITRIKECGGKISLSKSGNLKITPWKLNITRSFGLQNIKKQFRGIISEPDIKELDMNDNEFDFLILASSGIFEKLNNDQGMKCIYNLLDEYNFVENESVHQLAGSCVDMLIKTALIKGSTEDVTCILIGFENFEKIKNSINRRKIKEKNQRQSLDKFRKTSKNLLKDIFSDESENVDKDEAKEENKKENKKDIKKENRSNKKIFTIRNLLKDAKE